MSTPLVSTVPTAPTTAKSMLARLLATENISVQHENIPTAFFDLKARSLHLPMWSNVSMNLYDMLVGHEVAHALFTPQDGWRAAIDSVSAATGCNKTLAKSYLNIVEDARIERMIKAKFPGLRADFIKGYATLNDRKFFGDLSNIGEMCFADRMNLQFKCGVHLGTAIRFSAEEAVFVSRVEAAKTWADVVSIAEDIIRWEQEQTAEDEQGNQPQDGADGEGEGESLPSDKDGEKGDAQDSSTDGMDIDADGEESDDQNGSGKSTSDSTDGKDQKSQDGKPSNNGGNATAKDGSDNAAADGEVEDGETAPMPTTNSALEESLKSLNATADEYAPNRVVRLPMPSTDAKEIVIDFTRIIADLKATGFAQYMNGKFSIADYTAATTTMATAFNRKKAADVFRRSTVAKTGALDTLRMNQYKWTDDIFRRTTRVAEGKNHGIVILLDWSGSMTNIMQSTIGQLLILTDFCRKVGVPFEVYAFTNTPYTKAEKVPNYGTPEYDQYWKDEHAKQDARTDALSLCPMNLLNFLSSRMKANEYETMKSALWNWRNMSGYDHRYAMNSTPTHAALLYASEIVGNFIKRNGIQIAHTVVLTDGEPTDDIDFSFKRWSRSQGNTGEVYSWREEYRTAVVMSDPMTGASYDVNRVQGKSGKHYTYGSVSFNAHEGRNHTTQVALDILRRRTGCKIHWIGLTERSRAISPENYGMTAAKGSNWKRDGFIRGTVAGWDSAVIVNAERFLRNTDGSVSSTAQKFLNAAEDKMDNATTKSTLANAFMESQIAQGSLRTVASMIGDYLAV